MKACAQCRRLDVSQCNGADGSTCLDHQSQAMPTLAALIAAWAIAHSECWLLDSLPTLGCPGPRLRFGDLSFVFVVLFLESCNMLLF